MVTFPPRFLPEKPQFQNYVLAVTKIDYLRYLLNTDYFEHGVHRARHHLPRRRSGMRSRGFEPPGKNLLFSIVIVLLMIPPVAVMIPEYAFFARLRIINTYYIWLLWGIGANPSLHIICSNSFFPFSRKDLGRGARSSTGAPGSVFFSGSSCPCPSRLSLRCSCCRFSSSTEISWDRSFS